MGIGRAEQHAIGYDGRTAPAVFQHAKKERQKQQLGLFCLGDFDQVVGHDIVVQAPLKRWIRQYFREFIEVGILVGQTVSVSDVRIGDPVHHHIHRADEQHGAVHIVAGKHGGEVVLAGLFVEEHLVVILLF